MKNIIVYFVANWVFASQKRMLYNYWTEYPRLRCKSRATYLCENASTVNFSNRHVDHVNQNYPSEAFDSGKCSIRLMSFASIQCIFLLQITGSILGCFKNPVLNLPITIGTYPFEDFGATLTTSPFCNSNARLPNAPSNQPNVSICAQPSDRINNSTILYQNTAYRPLEHDSNDGEKKDIISISFSMKKYISFISFQVHQPMRKPCSRVIYLFLINIPILLTKWKLSWNEIIISIFRHYYMCTQEYFNKRICQSSERGFLSRHVLSDCFR